ncbi:MAG: DUF3307 domain-containing protein [Daejeonella sp.]
MLTEELSVLLRLLIAHLLTDFVFQPSSWVADRKINKYRSTKLYLHVFITAIFAWLFAGLWNNIWIPVIILITHFAIDLWKSYRPDKLKYFVADQLLHVLVLLFLWLTIFDKWDSATETLYSIYSSSQFLIVISAFLIVTWPLGIVIGIATEKWRKESAVNAEGLEKAGLWIGLFERFLILTFILIDQYTAVGLLIAAKSILRFSDKENTQKKTEYVLIGTLMSFSASVLLGWAVKTLLQII